MKRFVLCLLMLLLSVTSVTNESMALPKSAESTWSWGCYYAFVYSEDTGYLEWTEICSEVLNEPEGEEEVPYEGCYYGIDCYDDYVSDP